MGEAGIPLPTDVTHVVGEEYQNSCHLHRDSLVDAKSRPSCDVIAPCLTSTNSLESTDFEKSLSQELDDLSLQDSFGVFELTNTNPLGHRSFDLMPNFAFDRDNVRSWQGSPYSTSCSGLPPRRGKGSCHSLGFLSCPETREVANIAQTSKKQTQKDAQLASRLRSIYKEGLPSLHRVATRGDYHIAAQLIKAGEKVNARNSLHRTPLHEVAIKGHVNIAKLLLENGAKVNSRDGWKLTPLHQAITWKHSKMVRLLLQYGAREKGTHLLQDVIMSNMEPLEDIICKLIARGANVNATDMTGQSPIHTAVRYGHGNIVKLLVEAGADVNKVSRGLLDRNHSKVLHNAREQLIPLELDHLLQDGWSPLRIAQKRKRFDLVVWLLGRGANVVICDSMGRFLHHKATAQRNCPTLHHILAHPDSPIDIKDIEGKGAIKLIFEDMAKSMVDSMTACGCCRNEDKDAHQIPTCDKNVNTIVLLIQHGVDLCDLYIHGYDLLYHLCSSKFSYDLRLLQAVLHSGNNLSELLSLTGPSCLNSLYRQKRMDMYDWLHNHTNNPRPLRNICRHQIRSHLRTVRKGRSIWTAVTSLPLPMALMDFLLLQEFQGATVTRHFSKEFPKQ